MSTRPLPPLIPRPTAAEWAIAADDLASAMRCDAHTAQSTTYVLWLLARELHHQANDRELRP